MASFTPSTPLDLSQMTNDELEDLVNNLGGGGGGSSAKPLAGGINWDDALFEYVLCQSQRSTLLVWRGGRSGCPRVKGAFTLLRGPGDWAQCRPAG